MRDIPANIIRERRDSLIVLKEKKSKIMLLNPDKKLYHEVKVDSHISSLGFLLRHKGHHLPLPHDTVSYQD